jgi:hypothetical protein
MISRFNMIELAGKVVNGVVVLDEGPKLAEGTRVKVVAEPEELPTLYERFKDFIGVIEGPPDMAEHHDHYAHGAPKRSEQPERE